MSWLRWPMSNCSDLARCPMCKPPVLVGDIGGTNSRWAIFDGELGPVSVNRTVDANTLKEAATRYLGESGQAVAACCVAVAGPVRHGGVRLTNGDWVGHCDDLDVPTRIVNDLEAAAHGVRVLEGTQLNWWSPPVEDMSTTLVLGVGTGFGGALIQDGNVVAMEPGHSRFVARDRTLFGELLDARSTVEDLVSGPGLVGIWRHLAQERAGLPMSAADIGPWVLANVDHDPYAAQTAKLFRAALADAVLELVRQHRVGQVVLMGGVIEAWASHLSENVEMEEVGALTGCAVGWHNHPHLALLGASHLACSLV
jgi:glucokinase